jgi:rubrerythrin
MTHVPFHAPAAPTRRAFLSRGATLSAAALALVGGIPLRGLAADHDSRAIADDVAILNVALGLEHEGIAAYQIGAESGLLDKPLLKVAVLFKGHHEGHREVLAKTIETLGGKPVEAAPMTAYRDSRKLAVKSIRSAQDVLRLAQRLELGAVNAYLGVIPVFGNRDLARVAGIFIADETLHYTALTQALGEPLPRQSMSFGA